MIVLYVKVNNGKDWKELERTEVQKNTHNTHFNYKSVLFYKFEEYQPLKFEVYDSDSKSKNLKDHDFLGFIEISLGNLVNNSYVSLFTLHFI